jgi:hypothetical protein
VRGAEIELETIKNDGFGPYWAFYYLKNLLYKGRKGLPNFLHYSTYVLTVNSEIK